MLCITTAFFMTACNKGGDGAKSTPQIPSWVDDVKAETTTAQMATSLGSQGFTVVGQASNDEAGVHYVEATKTINGKEHTLVATKYPGAISAAQQAFDEMVNTWKILDKSAAAAAGISNLAYDSTSMSFTFEGYDYFFAISGDWLIAQGPADDYDYDCTHSWVDGECEDCGELCLHAGATTGVCGICGKTLTPSNPGQNTETSWIAESDLLKIELSGLTQPVGTTVVKKYCTVYKYGDIVSGAVDIVLSGVDHSGFVAFAELLYDDFGAKISVYDYTAKDFSELFDLDSYYYGDDYHDIEIFQAAYGSLNLEGKNCGGICIYFYTDDAAQYVGGAALVNIPANSIRITINYAAY